MKENVKGSQTPIIELEDLGTKDYLAKPTSELLEEFGKGNHIPGSGSAAILSALLGIEMMRTVIKLTISKEEYKNVHEGFKHHLSTIEEYKPKLTTLFNDDIREFHKVSFHRRKRDIAYNDHLTDEYEKHRKLAIEQLKIATEIPLEVCRINLTLINIALVVFDNGFKSARGDSGVAISNLLSAISGSLYIIFLNLKSIKPGRWKEQKKIQSIDLLQRYEDIQTQAYARVVNLYNEGVDDSNQKLNAEQLSLF